MSEILDSSPPLTSPDSPAPNPVAEPRWWADLRPLLLRLHFYVGLFVGPFLLVVAVTGLLYTLTPQLEQIVHRHELTTEVGTVVLPLRAQVASATAAVPDGTVIEIRPSPTPDGTTRVMFESPPDTDGYTRTAFVDPYTGQVRGVLRTYGEWLPVRAWFDELHRTLHLGRVGEVYSEVAASWLWVLVFSGLGVWVARRRRTRRVRRTLLPEGSARGRARLRSWHGSVGLWAAIGMLFLSATGLTWSQFAGANVTALRSALEWKTPSVSTTLPASDAAVGGRPVAGGPVAGAPVGGGPVGGGPVADGPVPGAPVTGGAGDPLADVGATADRVLAAARTAGLSDPVAITPSGSRVSAWVVQQTQRSWPEKQDSVAVDPSNGAIVDQLRFADWPLAAKLARWGIDSHMGLLFGVANQVLLAVLALGIICLVVWGYRMWWLRGPPAVRGAASRARPEAPRRPGFGAVLIVGLLAVGIGLFLPVLGTTLIAFLAFDVLRQHRRPTAGEPTPAAGRHS